jgi:DNA-binding MarR family transcriptional regulator
MTNREGVAPDLQQASEARLPTALLREILEVSDEFESRLARALHVNPTDLQAMEHLIQSGPLSPTELSRRLGMSAAAVTTVIDRLEAVGHATRAPHPDDRRAVRVAANPESVRAAMAHLLPMIRDVDAVLDEFDEGERSAVQRYLERVVEVYRRNLPA